MAAVLEYDEFAKHLNTKFRVRLNENETVEAELIEISEHLISARQDRFALVFLAANEPFLGQGQREFEHDQMGEFTIFLVPIERDDRGTSYEAVFNRVIKRTS